MSVRVFPSGANPGGRLRRDSSVVPREQPVGAVDRVVGDRAEDVGQPRLRFDAVELGAFDQGRRWPPICHRPQINTRMSV